MTVWQFLKNVKHIPIIGARQSPFRYLPKKKKSLCPHLYTNVTQLCFVTAKTRKQAKCPTTEKWINKRWHIHNTIQQEKRMKAQDILRHAWISTKLSWVKEARLKRVYTVWFHLCELLDNANECTVTESRSVAAWEVGRWRGRRGGRGYKGAQGNLWGWGIHSLSSLWSWFQEYQHMPKIT